jgi:salicylate biosynthesis isochorismate synthase/menaquinone-specific isochorismate synthase
LVSSCRVGFVPTRHTDALALRCDEAVARARRGGRPVLASVTVPLEGDVDVAAVTFASRRADERWFVWEQPDRDGFAIGALGVAAAVDSVPGEDRFAHAARMCSDVLRGAVRDEEIDAPATGPIWVGGFSFFPDGCDSPEWSSFGATSLSLPDLSIARSGGTAHATLNVMCHANADPHDLAARATARLDTLSFDPLPLVDPDPAGGYDIASVRPPTDFEHAVAEGARLVREGAVDKVVLAREVRVSAARPFNPGAVFGALRSAYPSCYCFCAGTPEAAFIAASPELLVRRAGSVLSTVALAGSTRRSADPAVDDHLGERLLHSDKEREEHRIVVNTIERSLKPLSVWVTPADEPALVKVANIQHLATPVRAQLAEPLSTIDLVGELHPTSAVGGEPWARAEPYVRELEQMDRGWYAAPVGWMDAFEDGEFCVGLRCTLLAGRTAHCFAGGGVVGESQPDAELAETEVKLMAVLPALTGS